MPSRALSVSAPSKFHKSRWVPLSPSATRAARVSPREGRRLIPRAAHNPMLLCSPAPRGYSVERA